jgi:hypothetical protein
MVNYWVYVFFFLFFCSMKFPYKKRLFISILLLLSSLALWGQKGEVMIEQDSLISQLMASKKEIDSIDYASKFFTVQLFYGDNKTAEELYEKIQTEYPEWEVDLSFETPNYKVQVGRYKDYYFGLNQLQEIKKIFPAAFLLEIKN